MSIQCGISETINTLQAIFALHQHERVCVIGTICCGKTTLLTRIPGCVDLDAELWPQLTPEEAAFISRTPWTTEIGDAIDRLVYEKIRVRPGRPLFTSIILDCEAVVYLDIGDALLRRHCQQRGADFNDAKRIKEAIEDDWNQHRAKGDKRFYYLTVTE